MGTLRNSLVTDPCVDCCTCDHTLVLLGKKAFSSTTKCGFPEFLPPNIGEKPQKYKRYDYSNLKYILNLAEGSCQYRGFVSGYVLSGYICGGAGDPCMNYSQVTVPIDFIDGICPNAITIEGPALYPLSLVGGIMGYGHKVLAQGESPPLDKQPVIGQCGGAELVFTFYSSNAFFRDSQTAARFRIDGIFANITLSEPVTKIDLLAIAADADTYSSYGSIEEVGSTVADYEFSEDELSVILLKTRYSIAFTVNIVKCLIIKWNQAFIPLVGTFVSSIEIDDGGSGYTSAPIVSISHAPGIGCIGAEATAVIDGAGRVVSVNITQPGSCYFFYPTVTLFGGGGSGAVAYARLDGDTNAQYTWNKFIPPTYNSSDPLTYPRTNEIEAKLTAPGTIILGNIRATCKGCT